MAFRVLILTTPKPTSTGIRAAWQEDNGTLYYFPVGTGEGIPVANGLAAVKQWFADHAAEYYPQAQSNAVVFNLFEHTDRDRLDLGIAEVNRLRIERLANGVLSGNTLAEIKTGIRAVFPLNANNLVNITAADDRNDLFNWLDAN